MLSMPCLHAQNYIIGAPVPLEDELDGMEVVFEGYSDDSNLGGYLGELKPQSQNDGVVPTLTRFTGEIPEKIVWVIEELDSVCTLSDIALNGQKLYNLKNKATNEYIGTDWSRDGGNSQNCIFMVPTKEEAAAFQFHYSNDGGSYGSVGYGSFDGVSWNTNGSAMTIVDVYPKVSITNNRGFVCNEANENVKGFHSWQDTNIWIMHRYWAPSTGKDFLNEFLNDLPYDWQDTYKVGTDPGYVADAEKFQQFYDLWMKANNEIGNMSDCGCGTPDGERAAAALKDFAESFAERNPHLRVFNMVLHMDEATPHLHVDFIPVATEQSRGLSTRVSMKQALKQQGFVGVGRKQTEWAAWMEREKEALTEIAQRHDFEIISLGTNRPHMDLPQFKEAAARLEAVQQQTAAVEREVAELERQRDALKGTVRLLKEADRVNAPLHDIQPEKTLTGAVKGVTVDQVEQLKKMALRSVTDRHKVQELTEENTRLRSQVPSMKKRLEEAQRQQRLEQENRRLRDENYYLQSELQEERSFTERLTDGIGRMLDFLEEHLPERLRPLLEKARELLPDPEIGQQQEQQQHQRGMGGMEL